MSTRGSVAWCLSDGSALGVYNHSDSYPTGLGADVFEVARRLGIASLIAELLQYGDWRELASGGVCQYCGKKTGQPHSISGLIVGASAYAAHGGRQGFVSMRKEQSKGKPEIWEQYEKEIAALDAVEANRKKTGYPDPEAKHHQHGDNAKDQFNPFLDPLFMEWVYVLDPVRNLIEVWASARHDPQVLRGYRSSGRSVPCGSGASYTHVLAAEVPLDSQPDWKAMEQVRERLAA
jgi:hypothetical protein